jgi:hypothetical protein
VGAKETALLHLLLETRGKAAPADLSASLIIQPSLVE